MMDFFDEPEFVLALFDFILEMELQYGKAQIEAGADIIGVGDAAASLIGPKFYTDFVWPYEKKLVEGLQAMGAHVRLHICGNTNAILEGMGKLGCEIVDLDYFSSLDSAREAMGPEQALLGNIDPVSDLRNSTPEAVIAAIAKCHQQAGERYIIGAGCEIPRDTPLKNIQALTDYANACRE
jgi:MtaA/CmuA family methyltransferase